MKDRKDNIRNAVICIFALSCVAILLATSMTAFVGNSGNRNTNESAYNNMYTNSEGYLVGVYDCNVSDPIGEKESSGQSFTSDTESDAVVGDEGLVGGTASDHFWLNNVRYAVYEDGCRLKVIDYTSKCGKYRDFIVPDYIEFKGKTYTVTEIDKYGFSSHNVFAYYPHSVEIGPKVSYIQEKAFSNYNIAGDHMTSFRIRDIENSQLSRIDAEAFREVKLSSFVFPATLSHIGKSAFRNCDKLTSVDFLPGNTDLVMDGDAFYDCDGLKSFNIGSGAGKVAIGTHCFEYCGVETFNIGKRAGGVEIDSCAFNGCKSLRTFTFEDVTKIYTEAFMHCDNLSSVYNLERIEFLDHSVFDGCHVTEVSFGKNLKEIGYQKKQLSEHSWTAPYVVSLPFCTYDWSPGVFHPGDVNITVKFGVDFCDANGNSLVMDQNKNVCRTDVELFAGKTFKLDPNNSHKMIECK